MATRLSIVVTVVTLPNLLSQVLGAVWFLFACFDLILDEITVYAIMYHNYFLAHIPFNFQGCLLQLRGIVNGTA